ncbi:MAG: hypothetical protein WD576_03310 [Nitriliruptoraceae bacterium]
MPRDANRNHGDELEYGPSGYLPERASKRARKIVLRAPLGLQWVVASVIAGVILVIAGVLFLRSGSAAPGEPWAVLMPLEEVSAAGYVSEFDVLVVGAGGRVRAFVGAGDVVYCPASNRLESRDGVWSLTGRGFNGADSLTERPTMVSAGVVYINPETILESATPSDTVARPQCFD